MPTLNKTKPKPVYRLVTRILKQEEEYLEIEEEVNKLISEGYVPLGPIQMAHTDEHTDIVQTMVLKEIPL